MYICIYIYVYMYKYIYVYNIIYIYIYIYISRVYLVYLFMFFRFFYYDNCYESPSFSDLAAPCSANFIEFLCGHCSETPTPDQKARLVCYEVNVSTLQPLQYTVYPYIVR